MNKYEKNKPVKQYDQMTLDEAIDDSVKQAKDTVADNFSKNLKTTCPDCHGKKNSLGKPLDCRTCNSTGSEP